MARALTASESSTTNWTFIAGLLTALGGTRSQWRSWLRAWLGSQRLANGRVGSEQLDRAHDRCMCQRSDAQLGQEALMAEDLMLEQDFLDHLLRTANHQRATQRAH